MENRRNQKIRENMEKERRIKEVCINIFLQFTQLYVPAATQRSRKANGRKETVLIRYY